MAYLLKDVHLGDLVDTIRAVANGERRFPPEVASRLAQRPNLPVLTRQELQILNLLVQGKTNKDIGAALFMAEGTVKGHINMIFAKLGVRERNHRGNLRDRAGDCGSPRLTEYRFQWYFRDGIHPWL